MVGPTNIPGNSSATVPIGTGRELIYEDSIRYGVVDPVLVRHSSYLSWRSVLAGSLLAVALLILSGAFAAAVGLSGYTFTRDGTYVFSMGAGIWMVFTALVAYFLAGSLAASLSVYRGRTMGVIHGLMAWVLSLPALIVLMGSATGGFLGRLPYFVGDVSRITPGMTTNVPMADTYTAIAWAGFLSLLVGMIFSAIGGAFTCTAVDRLIHKAAPVA